MLGTGPNGRKYLLPRPPREEVEQTLWCMMWGAKEREEEIRLEVKSRKEEWRKKESELRDWENELEVRESRTSNQDEHLVELMKDLSLKDVDLREKDQEIKRLRVEIDEMMVRAREQHKREIKVLLVYVLCCVFKVYFCCRI